MMAEETVQKNSKVLSFVESLDYPEKPTKVNLEAKQALNAMDFPTTRVEDWKYTRVSKISNKTFKQEKESADASDFFIPNAETHKLVYINGFFDENQSEILEDEAIKISAISDLNHEDYANALEDIDENVFSLINKAFGEEGNYVEIAKNKKAKYPIQIINIITGNQNIANSRFFIKANQGSKAEVFFTFDTLNGENNFTNIVIEGEVEENASLNVAKIQNENRSTFHISNEQFIQHPNSNFAINTITLGGLLVRNGLNIIVDGQNCYTELNGAYLGRGKQHLDNHTLVDHLYSNCSSSETYKGVMDDKSTGVFNGKVIVRQDAQKIEAYQSNGNILISDSSSVNSKPELEIYADDVRCSHGSTIGQLDEEAVFYLTSRGIARESAIKLLVAAFIGEALDKIQNPDLRNHLNKIFEKEFGWEF